METLEASVEKPIVMCIGLPDQVSDFMKPQMGNCHVIKKDYSLEILENPDSEHPAIIFCGSPNIEIPLIEVGQSLRMLYPQSQIYLITYDRQNFSRPLLHKNGFTDSYLLPGDHPEILRNLRRDISRATGGKVKAFRKVQLVDITPDSPLGFDLYLHLPANNRRVLFVSAKESLDTEKAEKLRKNNHQSMFITEDQVKDFYAFTARQLKNLNNNLQMSATEKAEKREKAVRDLLTGIFCSSEATDSLENGREIMNTCHEIVKSYILLDSERSETWYEQLVITAANNSESSAYTRAANTSTYAALLGIALGMNNPEELALAGLLHDIGLAQISPEILNKNSAQWSLEEKTQYEQHPLYSVRIIKERRMNVSEKICSIIEQHHEQFDGTGFPTKMGSSRILKEAQILFIADQLDDLTTIKEGAPRVSIVEAVRSLAENGLRNPAKSSVDPTILRQLLSLFPRSA